MSVHEARRYAGSHGNDGRIPAGMGRKLSGGKHIRRCDYIIEKYEYIIKSMN